MAKNRPGDDRGYNLTNLRNTLKLTISPADVIKNEILPVQNKKFGIKYFRHLNV